MRIERFALGGEHVELVPLAPEHVAGLVAAASIERSSYRFTEVPHDEDAMAGYVDKLLAQRDAGAAVPLAQRLPGGGRLVGCTRFMELRCWGGATPDEVEIGGTWLAADVQRTPVNTEAKLLLLTHAFETWAVGRVALCTDARNERSRAAIERIGAVFEGVLRHHRPSTVAGEDGRLRDSALFALTDDDWPLVRERLRARLGSR